jgi:hypothetical protein
MVFPSTENNGKSYATDPIVPPPPPSDLGPVRICRVRATGVTELVEEQADTSSDGNLMGLLAMEAGVKLQFWGGDDGRLDGFFSYRGGGASPCAISTTGGGWDRRDRARGRGRTMSARRQG